MAPLLAAVLDKALMSEAELAELIRTGSAADDHAG